MARFRFIRNVLDRGVSEYYMRVTATFETAAEKYGWLNRVVSVAMGHRIAGGAIYHVFEIL